MSWGAMRCECCAATALAPFGEGGLREEGDVVLWWVV